MFFKNATTQQLEALTRCRLPELKPFVELLRESQTATEAALVKADDPMAIYRLQGRVSVLKEVISAIEKSPETLARKRSAQR